jgi:hypothetical protein
LDDFWFSALNGKDAAIVSERAKAPDVAEFLEVIGEEKCGCNNEAGGV